MSQKSDFKEGAALIGHPDLTYLGYQCSIEEIIYAETIVRGKPYWHALCDDVDDCECSEHDRG